jgi:4'-phosphopantetheinyl transferase
MNEPVDHWQSPPVNLSLAPGEVHIWRVGLDRPPLQLADLRRVLNQDELDRAARFYFERDRQHFSAGRAILRNILSLYLKVDPARLEFEYGPQGKPALAPEFNPGPGRLEFNLSNSRELALIALTLNQPLGIDLEYITEKPAIPDMVKRFFAPGEVKAFAGLAPEQQQMAFDQGWTCKEAYIKALGGGLSIGLDQFEVSLDPSQPTRLLSLETRPEAVSRWSIERLYPGPSYLGALAIEGRDYRLKYWRWPD